MYQEESVLPLLPLNENSYVIESDILHNGLNRKISLNVFDRDGTIIATKLKGWLPHNSRLGTFIDRILSSPTCFTVSIHSHSPNGMHIKNVHFFKTLLVIENKPSHMREFTCVPYDHSLSREMLYTIKYFQLSLGSNRDEDCIMLSRLGNFEVGYNLHKLHPDLFKSPQNHRMIEDPDLGFRRKHGGRSRKEEEDKVISEQLDKLRIGLENKETILEKKQIRLMIEESKLLEEKSILFEVKQQLDLMKQELQIERDAFEKEKQMHKIKKIDLDEYFEIPVATVVATKVSPTIGEMILGYVDL